MKSAKQLRRLAEQALYALELRRRFGYSLREAWQKAGEWA